MISHKLPFTRTDKLSDPFEGVTYKLIAEIYFARKSNITNPTIDQRIKDQKNQKKVKRKIRNKKWRRRDEET